MISYSIIIPNRNQIKLLSRAISSIPQRKDVEVIIVDDASDPSQADKHHYPGQERPDCQVIFTTEGKGAGYARNIGMEHASGKWLLFLDSDDFFTEGFLDLLDSHCNDDDDDIIFFGCKSVDSATLQPSKRIDYRRDILKRYANCPRKIDFYNRYLHTEPWGKMIRRDFLLRERIRFEETTCANDYLFSVVSGHKARHISYDNRVLYCLTSRSDSLSQQYFDKPEKARDRLLVYWHVQKFFHQERIPLFPFFMLWRMYTGESPVIARLAESFRQQHHISRVTITCGCLLFRIRKRFRIGVPYC